MLAAVLWSPTMLAESSDDVLYSVGRVWVVRGAASRLPGACIPIRPTRERGGPASARWSVGRLAEPDVGPCGRVPGAEPMGQLRHRLPAQCVHAAECRTRLRRRRAAAGGQATSVIVLAGVAVQLLRRLLRGTSLMRLELVPVLAAAVVRIAATVAFLLARGADPNAQLTEVLGAIAWLGTPVVSVGFLIGLVLRGAPRTRWAAERSSGPTECAAIAGRNRRCGRRLARDRLSDVWRSGRMGGRQGAPRHAARGRGGARDHRDPKRRRACRRVDPRSRAGGGTGDDRGGARLRPDGATEPAARSRAALLAGRAERFQEPHHVGGRREAPAHRAGLA